MPASDIDVVHHYHDQTKHHFHRFARSLGYLDWASQPHPFRSFDDADVVPLSPSPAGPSPPAGRPIPVVPYERLFETHPRAREAIDPAVALGDVLRHALGLSAWKQFQRLRWSLRVNPSSGNLHPTEAYVVCGALAGLSAAPAVFHYAADRHALERRCAFDQDAWEAACSGRPDVVLVALTSVHWRESWKYGERAFRYCQHDLGHAIAALCLAARIVGWGASLLHSWSHDQIAALTGVDRHDEFPADEREEPGCLIAFAEPGVRVRLFDDPRLLVAAVGAGSWMGRASRLSQDHVTWALIDDIAAATRDPGRPDAQAAEAVSVRSAWETPRATRALDARRIVLQRRSAIAFDGRSSIGRDGFFSMLARVMPGPHAPWDALWWTPCVHLVLFVHRVDDVGPGLYVLVREAVNAGGGHAGALETLRAACGRDFMWEPAHDALPLLLLARGNCTRLAERLSCDQEIASHGYFSFGMIAAFGAGLERHGPSFYRHLFWETGVIGQVMYLEAEAAGSRATGIGCFYDDPVHDVLGLRGHEFQSLYHFTVGTPVEDARLLTEPGYAWEPRREPADGRSPEAAGVAIDAGER